MITLVNSSNSFNSYAQSEKTRYDGNHYCPSSPIVLINNNCTCIPRSGEVAGPSVKGWDSTDHRFYPAHEINELNELRPRAERGRKESPMNATDNECACPEPGAKVIHQEDAILVSHEPWCPLTSVRIDTVNRTGRKVQRLVREAKGERL